MRRLSIRPTRRIAPPQPRQGTRRSPLDQAPNPSTNAAIRSGSASTMMRPASSSQASVRWIEMYVARAWLELRVSIPGLPSADTGLDFNGLPGQIGWEMTEPRNFLLRYVGARFNGHRLPLDVLPDQNGRAHV